MIENFSTGFSNSNDSTFRPSLAAISILRMSELLIKMSPDVGLGYKLLPRTLESIPKCVRMYSQSSLSKYKLKLSSEKHLNEETLSKHTTIVVSQLIN